MGTICTRESLHDSNVAFHCKKSLAAILGGKLSEEVFCRPSTAPVVLTEVMAKIVAVLQQNSRYRWACVSLNGEGRHVFSWTTK